MDIAQKNEEYSKLDYIKALQKLCEDFKGQRIKLSTSFSLEDQVITDAITQNKLPIEIFTIDTSRMFNETYKVWQETEKRYQNIKITAYYPDYQKLQEYTKNKGINAFYNSKAERIECCSIRKIAPLKEALKDCDIWLSGIRKVQSLNRSDFTMFEEDKGNNVIKFYPILNLTDEEMVKIIKDNDIPYNELHDKGYLSIGCQPCTRAVSILEDSRAGRWWWEKNDQGAECGLHFSKDGIVKTRDVNFAGQND